MITVDSPSILLHMMNLGWVLHARYVKVSGFSDLAPRYWLQTSDSRDQPIDVATIYGNAVTRSKLVTKEDGANSTTWWILKATPSLDIDSAILLVREGGVLTISGLDATAHHPAVGGEVAIADAYLIIAKRLVHLIQVDDGPDGNCKYTYAWTPEHR